LFSQVVLTEHFRCAPKIIEFSNEQFYDGRLVPLRLPTKAERLSPNLVDVKVNGVKTGKVNEKEAEKIVEMVREYMNLPGSDLKPRTIGVISLIGDEQSRLIRGRLLDAVGPEKMARHDILIGDPPTFQGAERDIVFLSMICSRGSVPTQSQLMHFQRANVALSRARDRMVLVRSIDLVDIPSLDDMKVPIIEFFMNANEPESDPSSRDDGGRTSQFRRCGTILKTLLKQRGFSVMDMGVVWKHAMCIDHPDGKTRAALMVDCDSESPQEWRSSYTQQKAIERVGWKCLRIDALSLIVDFDAVLKYVIKFLASLGIEEPVTFDDEVEEEVEEEKDDGDALQEFDGAIMEAEVAQEDNEGGVDAPINLEEDDVGQHDAVAISSDEESVDCKPAATRPDTASSSFDFGRDEEIEASRFGRVVDLGFLREFNDAEPSVVDKASRQNDESDDDDDDDDARAVAGLDQADGQNSGDDADNLRGMGGLERPPVREVAVRTVSDRAERPSHLADLDSSEEENSMAGVSLHSSRSKRKYRRLDKHSRDGRWYPGRPKAASDEKDQEWYDTDSDLPKNKEDDSNESEEDWVETRVEPRDKDGSMNED
jgi:hypothetical protein